MDENLFIFLNSFLNILLGFSIFYSMHTGHCLNNGFWAFLASFLILLGLFTIFYYFILPILQMKSMELVNKIIFNKLLILIKKYNI